MKLRVCKKICNECPFKKDSLKSWLGELNAQQTLNVQQYEGLFPCHKRRSGEPEQIMKETINGIIPICRGFIVSANLSYKLFGSNPETGQALKKLQMSLNSSEEELNLVLNRKEFLEHHTL